MKRFLGILVVSMFLGSAAHAQETVSKSRAETEDRRVGFVGVQKKSDEENNSNIDSGTEPESRALT